MKRILLPIILIFLASCGKEQVNYPNYSLEKTEYVPDSLKAKHREWIKETIRASNQHLSAGDYEDIDETIIQAERTGNSLFKTSVIGLRKEIDENYWNDIVLKPNEMTQYELKVLDSLKNIK